MFAIIADDLSGAAELAGIALQYGIRSEIQSETVESTDADLLIINTSSRGLTQEEAFLKVKKSAELLLALNPDWIYKKTDSVLRGNILAEIAAILNIFQLKRSLLSPANPGLNRTIVDQKYMINNREITQTSFAEDPDYPCKTADVLGLLGEFDQIASGYLTENETLPEEGVFITEIKNDKSLEYWVEKINEDVLAAGAAEFFEKILRKKGYKSSKTKVHKVRENDNILFICGSSHQNSRMAIEKAAKKGAIISYMPEQLIYQKGNLDLLFEKWAMDIFESFRKTNSVVLAVSKNDRKIYALKIQSNFSLLTERLLFKKKLAVLAIEGGETAQEITKRLKINSFRPKNLLSPGVVELETKIKNPATVIIKPGSYLWPDSFWRFN